MHYPIQLIAAFWILKDMRPKAPPMNFAGRIENVLAKDPYYFIVSRSTRLNDFMGKFIGFTNRITPFLKNRTYEALSTSNAPRNGNFKHTG